MSARAVSFVDFVQGVLKVKLTPAQRVLALVAFDGVEPCQLDEADRELAKVLFGPVDTFPPVARGVLVAVCGRGSGKTYLLALYNLWRALVADLSALAPGERAVAVVVAPDKGTARQALRFAHGAAESCPSIGRLVTSEAADGFVVRRSDGKSVSLEVAAATRGGSSLRGRSFVSAGLDETAFHRDESAVVNDVDLFDAVAPRILPGGMIVVASTPWAESGLLYTEFTKNWGDPKTAIAARAPTLLMNPSKFLEVARERERNPDKARREMDAEFIGLGSNFYFGAELSAAIDRDLDVQLKPQSGASVTIGGDVGLVNDASAFVAVHRVGDVVSLAEVLELRPKKGSPLRLSEVVKQGCAFAERHGRKTIHVDHHALEPAREWLPKGLKFEPIAGGQEAKAERFRLLKEALRCGNIRIPGPLSRVASQLADVIGKPTPGGGTSITMPRRNGHHNDVAAAFVVAVANAVEPTYRTLTQALMAPTPEQFKRLMHNFGRK